MPPKKPARETYALLLQQRPFVSAAEAAAALGVTKNYVHVLARERGIRFPVRPTVKATTPFFQNWTPESAWVWGVLTASAVMDAESFTLSVPNAERNLISKIRDLVVPEASLIERVIQRIGLSVRARALVKRFQTVQLEEIPLPVLSHYLRGRLDGTGELTGEHPPYQCWLPGDFSYLVQLRRILPLLTGYVEPRLIKRAERYWLAWEDPQEVLNILTWVYHQSVSDIRGQLHFGKYCQMLVAQQQPLPPGLYACHHCGDYINSRTVHDFQSCYCGRSSIDGGQQYHRVVWDPEGPPPRSVADLLSPQEPEAAPPASPPVQRKRGRRAQTP